MLEIAICDDEKPICDELLRFIEKAEITKGEKFEVAVFYSGEDLINTLKTQKQYDVLFLDVDLKTKSGAEIGVMIREELLCEYAQIIYISSSKEYAMELFESRPLDFLIKPVTYEQVLTELLRAEKCLQSLGGHLTGKNADVKCKVQYNDIIYMESENRTIVAYTEQGRVSLSGKLAELEALLPENFIVIHKSIIVNYNFITKFAYDNVYMTTGERLPISPANRKFVRQKLLKLCEVTK